MYQSLGGTSDDPRLDNFQYPLLFALLYDRRLDSHQYQSLSFHHLNMAFNQLQFVQASSYMVGVDAMV
jgi:hypothetical protein